MIPPRSFFARDALDVAPLLLGGILRTRVDGEVVAVMLTEVEAYHGLGTGPVHDPGSHAKNGRTARNDSMWRQPGHLYVYFTYGMHSSANVVCSPDGQASGVLLRAGRIVEGIDVARRRRSTSRSDDDLARGPGRFAVATGLLHPVHDGLDALSSADAVAGPDAASLELPASAVAGRAASGILRGPRVGVSGPGGGPEFPWRFWLPDEPSVSPYRAARPGRSA